MRRVVLACGSILGALASVPANAQLVPREAPISGRIVNTKGGETAVLVPSSQIRRAGIRQDLKAGDVLRTNASGTMAIVFADRTQLRLGRNSVLVVRSVRNGSPSSVRLEAGSLWGRTPRNGTRLSIETPTAAAAIRGTSWTISAADEIATLQVFEGSIEFANDQGSLRVDAGQAAVARLGQAPSRIVVVNSSERRQMLQYVPITEGLRYLDGSNISADEARNERARISAIPDAMRTAEDWLLLAEIDAQRAPISERRRFLAAARALPLTEVQQARSLAIEAGIAIDDGKWELALQSYQKALPLLPEKARATALFGEYAASLSGVGEKLPPPALTGDAAGSASAYLAAYRGEMDEALTIIRAAEVQQPRALDLQIVKGTIALLLGDIALLQEAVERGNEIDAGDPNVLMLAAQLESDYLGNHRRGEDAARMATTAAPGNSLAWNVLGTVLLNSGWAREAEAAFRRGLAERENDALLHANLAVTLLDQNRLAEAEREIDRALALDPGLAIALAYRGRLMIQMGAYDAAEATLLEAAAANPAYGQTALMLSQVHYRRREYAAAEQQLSLAEEYDPISPFPALFRAAMALDQYESGEAIAAAREAYARRESNGQPSNLPDRASQSLNQSFRFLGLGDWGRYYSDLTFVPLDAASYLGRAAGSQASPFLVDKGVPADRELPTAGGLSPFSDILPANALEVGTAYSESPFDAQAGINGYRLSNVLQGLTLDPLLAASSRRQLRLFHERFLEGEITGGLTAANDAIRSTQSARLAGLLASGPLAFNLGASHVAQRGPTAPNADSSALNLEAALGAQFGSDTLVVIATLDAVDREVSGPAVAPRDQGSISTQSLAISAVYSYFPAETLRLSLGASILDDRTALLRRDAVAPFTLSDFSDEPGVVDADLNNHRKRGFATASALLELGGLTLSAGGEVLASKETTDEQSIFTTLTGDAFTIDNSQPGTWDFQHNYFAHARYWLLPAILVEGYGTAVLNCSECENGEADFEYGGAVAYRINSRNWLRAGYIVDIQTDEPFSLGLREPAGLRPAAAPASGGSSTRSILLRLDSEWSPNLFTTIEIQRQTFEDLVAPVSDDFGEIGTEPFGAGAIIPGLESVSVGDGTLWRASMTANALVTSHVGVVATYARTVQDAQSFDGFNFVPRHFGKLALEWSAPKDLRGGVGMAYVGRRSSFDEQVDSFISLDADIAWRSPNHAIEVRLEVLNLLGERIEFYPGYPKHGRQLNASMTARF